MDKIKNQGKCNVQFVGFSGVLRCCCNQLNTPRLMDMAQSLTPYPVLIIHPRLKHGGATWPTLWKTICPLCWYQGLNLRWRKPNCSHVQLIIRPVIYRVPFLPLNKHFISKITDKGPIKIHVFHPPPVITDLSAEALAVNHYNHNWSRISVSEMQKLHRGYHRHDGKYRTPPINQSTRGTLVDTPYLGIFSSVNENKQRFYFHSTFVHCCLQCLWAVEYLDSDSTHSLFVFSGPHKIYLLFFSVPWSWQRAWWVLKENPQMHIFNSEHDYSSLSTLSVFSLSLSLSLSLSAVPEKPPRLTAHVIISLLFFFLL